MTLIIGTPDSGKSQLAETVASDLACGKEKIYIATMIPYGEDGIRRVEKHRRMREGKGFITLEKPHSIKELIPQIQGKDCLLECMSNLVGNEMFCSRPQPLQEDIALYIAGSVAALSDAAQNLTVVTNIFDTDGPEYDDSTREYTSMVERVNSLLIQKADRIYEKKNGEWLISENI